MTYSIRAFAPGDAETLAELTLAAIKQVGAVSYTPEQVTAWAARHPGPERFLARAEAGHTIWVACETGNQAVAYALMEPGGHLDMLYCHPDHTRKGLADRLLEQAETYALSEEIGMLYTQASELARPAFERAGYSVTERRDFEIEGIAIYNFAMEKPLK
ncbi:MAG: GNAT family N-acetyltransferase [Erythrobacter sp.]